MTDVDGLVPEELAKCKLVLDFSRFSGRLGILGGSFDPVHTLHLEIARDLLDRVVDNVVFIPAWQNPLKNNRPSADRDRLAMLLLAVAEYPHFYVSPIELRRQSTSYTVETLRELRTVVNPEVELALILGSDCLKDLPRWNSIEDIFALAKIVMVQRNEDSSLEQWHAQIAALPLSEQARQCLISNFQMRTVNHVSSTNIRNAIRGHDDRSDLPKSVADYITQHGLYRIKDAL